MRTLLTRRSFARLALAAAGSIALGPARSWAQLGRDDRRSTAPRRVVVLGAGIAGLAAALKLREIGHEVVILEARTRPGGRVRTVREPFSDGVFAEAGAARIPSTHHLTREYVGRFGLELEPFFPDRGTEVFLWRGQRVLVPHGGSPDLSGLDVGLTHRERDAGFAGLTELYLGTLLEELRRLPEAGWPFPELDRYKDKSFAQYLAAQGASADAIAQLAQGFEEDSLLDFVHDGLSHVVPELSKIRGGNDLLPHAMARSLSEQIRYGAAVRRIEQDEKGVRVTFETAGGHHVETGDRIICTIPFTVLREIEVAPAWSPPKAAAIRELYLGPVARVFVQTRTRFWEQAGLNGFATVDQPMEIWSPTHNQPGTRGLVMSYIYERLAREYSSQPPSAQIERALDLFEQIHPGLRAQTEAAATWSWLNEPYSKGAFLVTKVGQFELLAHAGTPEGRIHFAGEHTSPWPGWIQGALHSGLRAADEVNRAA